jgi:hypothetical protein
MHFDLSTTEQHTGYPPWMLSTLYFVKFLPLLLWTEAFKNTRFWKTMKHSERTFISTKILWGIKDYTFSHGTEHTQSLRLKAMPQSDFKSWTNILKNQWIPNWRRKITHTHTYTHTKCWYTVRFLVSK